MKVNLDQAKEFMKKINEKDRIAIITHDDMDGFCSGKLFLEFCKKKKCKEAKVFILSYGKSNFSEFDLKRFNKLLLSDLAPAFVSEEFKKLSKEKEILYTDHHQEESDHIIVEYVNELRTTSEGYIPSSRTCFELTEKENKEFRWVSVLGVLSDMGHVHAVNNSFLNNIYSETGKDFDFYWSLAKRANSVIIYFSPDFEKAFEKFSELKNLEDIDKLNEYNKDVSEEFMRLGKDFSMNHDTFRGILYFKFESKFPAIKSALITSLSSENPEKIYIFVTPKVGKISISARNQSRKYDVSKLLKDCTNEFENSQAGGHKAAAAAIILNEELDKFKENLKKYNIEECKI